MSTRPVAVASAAGSPPRSLVRWGGVALVLIIAGISMSAASGCSCKQEWSFQLEDHRELRLRGLAGEAIEEEVVAALERNHRELHPYHVETLKILGTERSRTLLELIREEGHSSEVREAAAKALEAIAARGGDEPDLIETRNAYFDRREAQARNDELDAYERMRAIQELFYFRPDTARRIADVYLVWFTDEEADVTYREAAYRYATELRAPEMVEALCAFAGDLAWFRERLPEILETIQRSHPQRYRELLRACLEDERIQIGAAFLLGELGDAAIVPVLKPWLESDEVAKRELALGALRHVESEEVAQVAASLIEASREEALLLPALAALSTNWQGEATFHLLERQIDRWPTAVRLRALEVLEENEFGGPRQLFFRLMREDSEPAVRALAIELRARGGEPAEQRDREALLAVLHEERRAEVVLAALTALVEIYGERWSGDGEACEALLATIEQRSSRRWAEPRRAALELLGHWGRFEDARTIHRLLRPRRFDDLHGPYAHRDSRGLSREIVGRTSHVIVPHYHAVESILARHPQEHAEAVRQYRPSLEARERAFKVHFLYLLEPALVRETWREVVQAKRPVQASDLRFFQPFAQPAGEEHWVAMFELLEVALRSEEDRIADAAFSVLGGRFLVKRGPHRQQGGTLEEIIAEAEDVSFVEVLKPAFRAVVEAGSARRLGWLAGLIERGVLEADDVAELAVPLFEREDLDGETAAIFLAQMTRELRPVTFDQQVAPVVRQALRHDAREVRRAAAAVVEAHFHLSQEVDVRLVRQLLEDDDPRVRDVGGDALQQLVRWIVERPTWDQTRRLREAVQPLLNSVASADSPRVRRYAAEAIGTLSALAKRPEEMDSPFVRSLRASSRTIVGHRANRDRPMIMYPVARFLAAFGEYLPLRSTLLELTENRNADVRRVALEGLGRQAAPRLLEPLRELLQTEREETVRQVALRVYRDAAIEKEALEPALWLVTDYARFQPGDEQFAKPIVAAWAGSTEESQRRRTLLALAQQYGEPSYSLLLPSLVEVAHPDLVPLLGEVVEQGRADHRAVAAEVLARIDGHAQADELLGELIHDERLEVRLAAARAATAQGRVSALAALVKRQGAAELSAEEAEALSEAVSGIVAALRETMSPAQQLSRLNELFDAAQAVEQQLYLLGELRTVEHPRRGVYLREHLHARNQEVRIAAMQHLASLEGEAALDDFLHLREDREKEVRLALVEALGGISVSAAFDFLRGMALEDREVEVRLAALQTLARDLHDASVTLLLREVMDDTRSENWPVRREAMRIVKAYRTANVQPLLLDGVEDGRAEVRVEAARGLVEFVEDPRGEMIDELGLRAATLTLLDDADPDARLAALGLTAYFVRQGDEELRELLRQLTEDEDRAVRARARRLVEELE